MKRNPTIRSIVALLLMVIFAISFTPENFFHAALAKHTDMPSCTDGLEANAHFHQKGYECHFNQPVVTASYLFEPASLAFSINFFNPAHNTRYYCSYKQPRFACKESRGPPQA